MNPNELPDIPGLITEGDSRISIKKSQRDNTVGSAMPGLALFTVGILSVVIAIGISCFLSIFARGAILTIFGANPEITLEAKMASALSDQSKSMVAITEDLLQLKSELTGLGQTTQATSQDISKISERVSAIEAFTSDLERRIAEHRKNQQAAIIEQKKRAVDVKPKPAKIIPLVLVSIRNQAGVPLVSLRDGLDRSELLMPGDSWRGWTFLNADIDSKTAKFKVANKIQELEL